MREFRVITKKSKHIPEIYTYKNNTTIDILTKDV